MKLLLSSVRGSVGILRSLYCENEVERARMGDTFSELLRVAKATENKDFIQKPTQTDQDYLYILLQTIGRSSDADWDSLSANDQRYYTDAVDQRNNKKMPIPYPEGFVSVHAVKTVVEKPVPIKHETAPQVQSVVPNVANTPKTKKSTKPTGIVDAIREMIILNPDWPTRKIHQTLVANGWTNTKLDVVAVNAGDIRKTIAKVKELGYWNDQKDQQKAV